MTHVHPQTTQGALRAQDFYSIENNESQSSGNVISTLRDELSTIIEEAQEPLRKELQELRNLLKDEIQQSQIKDEEIQALKKTQQELTEILKRSSITTTSLPPIKNNIFYSPHDPDADKLIMRTHGLGNDSKRGRYARDSQVMLEFVSKFPKTFDLDIKGYFTQGFDQELPEDTYFEVHIGRDGKEIKHTKKFKLFKENLYRNNPDFTTVEFATEDEDNNTIWIDMPKIPEYHDDKSTIFSGLDLHVLNIIPRKK